MRLEIGFDQDGGAHDAPRDALPGDDRDGARRTTRSLVPVDVVFVTEAGPMVWRKTATGFEARRVEVGQRNKDLVEVRAGLDAG